MNSRLKDTTPPELLRAVAADAPIVLFALDEEGKFTLSTGRGLDALGLSPGEVVGRSVFEVYSEEPAVLEACRRALSGETLTGTLVVGGAAFETRYTPLLDWGGKVVGVVGVATDVTEAYRGVLARDEFLSVLTHELRTPLASALGWAHMLRDEELDAAETRQAVETITRNLDELKTLISSLREAAQAASGRLSLRLSAFDLGAAVKEAAKSLKPAADARAVALKVEAPPLKIRGDRSRLRQVAWALISNAVKFSPKGESVSVRLERSGRDALLTVADRGPGLPESLRRSVFDLPRLPAADAPQRARGLGLGLPMARRLVELHGGAVSVVSESGRGAVFTVRLPLGRH
jgi:PAS domain S-box-containing protein